MRERFFLLFGLKAHVYSWKGLAWLALFYLAAIVFGAIVVTPVYNMVQAWNRVDPNDLNTYLAGKSFRIYFDRARWVFAILSLPCFFSACGFLPYSRIRRRYPQLTQRRAFFAALSVGFHRLGISCKPAAWRLYTRWFCLGVLVTAVVVIAQLLFTQTSLKPEASTGHFFKMILSVFASALALGFFEEIVFRGIIFRCFYTAFKPLVAVLLASAFFAYTHFRHPHALFAQANQAADFAAGWGVAFWTLFGIFKSFNWLSFMSLFMLGNSLCLMLMRTRSLMSTIGFHGGIVFIMLNYTKSFNLHDDASRLWWGGRSLVDGIIPLVLLTGLTILLARPFWQKLGPFKKSPSK